MKANPSEVERVRRYTAPERQREIDASLEQSIRFFSTQSEEAITGRVAELDREWSIERYLDTNAGALACTGAVLGLTVNRKWLLLTLAVAGFLAQHALAGWCPPVPLLRRLGVRTRAEIDREKFALKALRGDFAGISTVERRDREAVPQVYRSVNA